MAFGVGPQCYYRHESGCTVHLCQLPVICVPEQGIGLGMDTWRVVRKETVYVKSISTGGSGPGLEKG